MQDFINHTQITDVLSQTATQDKKAVKDIIDKALELKGLAPEEAAVLLHCEDRELISEIFAAARTVKKKIYGRRLVLFAPLYISNYCSNNCVYCGFRRDNTELKRSALKMDEIATEVRALENEGHKRLLMLCGENHGRSPLDYFIEAIETAYSIKTEKGGEIRRINIEIAPQTIEGFKRLKAADIGTYVLFQETYHPGVYKDMHPPGPKADYSWRLSAHDRAMEAGIDDVGIGALFGLNDYKYEALGLLYHALHLVSAFGVGPHTISVPRLEPALNAPAAVKPPCPVSDDEFKKLVAVLRLAVPYTGMILSTRETMEVRSEVIELGISQISAGSKVDPGGYANKDGDHFHAGQFNLGDTRTLDEVIHDITLKGHIPSFCTACYRLGRTGADFMSMAKPGEIKHHCDPNGLSTFMEYLMDYASTKTKETGEQAIQAVLADMPHKDRKRSEVMIERIKRGARDIYF
jgi:2-iminoacetate synthase